MNWLDILTQGTGILGTISFLISFQCRKTRTLMLVQCISMALFSVHYAFLQAWPGFVIEVLATVRTLLLWVCPPKIARHPLMLAGSLAAFAIGGIFTYENLLSLFPVVAMAVSSYTLWTQNPFLIRRLQLLCMSPLWLVYNAAVGSISGCATDVINITSVLIAIYRFGWIKPKHPDKLQEAK